MKIGHRANITLISLSFSFRKCIFQLPIDTDSPSTTSYSLLKFQLTILPKYWNSCLSLEILQSFCSL